MSERSDFYFQSYDEWRHALTVRCNINLTPDYARERIAVLRDSNDRHTQEFAEKYGQDYLQQVIQWFEQAASQG